MASITLNFVVILVLFQCSFAEVPFFGFVPIPQAERPSFIRDDKDSLNKDLHADDIPDSLDWRDYGGTNYMSWMRNQHIPEYCGSCWVMSATTALASRIMIARKDAFPEIAISPQLILDCDTENNNGCSGGDALDVYEYFHINGAVEDSCSPYVALSWHDDVRSCDDYSYCSFSDSVSDPAEETSDQYAYFEHPRFYVDEYGYTEDGEDDMIRLLQDGPIVCGMAVNMDFYKAYEDGLNDGGIYIDTTGTLDMDHEIVILGYGYDEETSTKYWIGANSWGSTWGEDGYFKILRGENNMAIEEYCVWATITKESVRGLSKSKITDDTTDSDDIQNAQDFTGSLGGGLLDMQSRLLNRKDPDLKGIRTSPLPQDYLHANDIPQSFSWGDYNGANLLNLVRQSNAPYRCDSCWAFGITEMISDRLNVMQYVAGNTAYVEVNLAPQVLINMEDGGGDCDGGYAGDAMQYLYDVGIPDETCQNYMAQNSPHDDETLNECYTCDPNNMCDDDSCCYEVDAPLFTVQEYGYIGGVSAMKNEIYARGPIACSMYVDSGFQGYEGGIYSSPTEEGADYLVTLVGWGYDEGTDTEYWIGKNNWGIAWGNDGYFKMELGVNSNRIEDSCIWGVPSFDDELLVLTRRMNELIPLKRKNKFSFLRWMASRFPAMVIV